jgi:signal transduction histidine kinase
MPTEPSKTRARRGIGLRGRLVLLSTAGLAVGLIVGAVVLTAVLRLGLERAADDAIQQTAHEVTGLIENDRLPDPIPAGGTTLVQVLDQQGRVLAASLGADRLVAALGPAQLQAALAGPETLSGNDFGVQGAVRVTAQSAAGPDGPSVVLVATPSSDIDDAVRVVRLSLIVGFAVLLAVLAAVAWRLIGATLRPVEALRAGAERITGSSSAATLPLPNSTDEIRRLAETLNDMLDRLAASRSRQRQFVADAAHELRSPLASLRTQLEVAIAIGDTPDNLDLLVDVQRLTGLVNDLLVLATVDDAAPPRQELVDLVRLTGDVVDRYAGQPIPISVSATGDISVQANPAAVERILRNVLDNAIRHAATAVRVHIDPAAESGARVVVTDDGPGIAVTDRERVFERFTRLQDARDRDSGGSGLGLAIVRELIEQQGGTVRLGEPVAGHSGLRVELSFHGESVASVKGGTGASSVTAFSHPFHMDRGKP